MDWPAITFIAFQLFVPCSNVPQKEEYNIQRSDGRGVVGLDVRASSAWL